jgi:D-arabinose 1-dehydrogenase-like Zn-dependent alcohol dehydrogenase
MDMMQAVGYAALILSGLAGVAAIVVKVAHGMGYEVPVLTKIADGLAKLAQLFTARPMVAMRRAARPDK